MVPGYELRWNIPLKYNDLRDQAYNPRVSYYTKKMILGPEIINVIYGLEFEIDTENPMLKFETADDL